MSRIFDNIDRPLLPALRETLVLSDRADFCMGYFKILNLRGWKQIDGHIERWSSGVRPLLPSSGGHAAVAAGKHA